MSYKDRIKRKCLRHPQNRDWSTATAMLIELLPERPMLVLCKRCLGEHILNTVQLTIECECGALTIYTTIGIFHMWSALAWTIAQINDDVIPWRKGLSVNMAIDAFGPLRSPQPPFDSRLLAWRRRLT